MTELEKNLEAKVGNSPVMINEMVDMLSEVPCWQISQEFSPVHYECTDFSDDACDGAKLEVVVVSEKFVGVPLIKRHRMVNAAVGDYMNEIHALTIKAWTPEQYEKKKGETK